MKSKAELFAELNLLKRASMLSPLACASSLRYGTHTHPLHLLLQPSQGIHNWYDAAWDTLPVSFSVDAQPDYYGNWKIAATQRDALFLSCCSPNWRRRGFLIGFFLVHCSLKSFGVRKGYISCTLMKRPGISRPLCFSWTMLFGCVPHGLPGLGDLRGGHRPRRSVFPVCVAL